MTPPTHLLIWDGDCGICQKVIDWVKLRDRRKRFTTVTFQRCPSPPMTPELRQQAKRAMQVLTADGRHIAGGRASLLVLEEIEWHPGLARMAAYPPFVWFVELGYSVVARNRLLLSRWFNTPVCSVPED